MAAGDLQELLPESPSGAMDLLKFFASQQATGKSTVKTSASPEANGNASALISQLQAGMDPKLLEEMANHIIDVANQKVAPAIGESIGAGNRAYSDTTLADTAARARAYATQAIAKEQLGFISESQRTAANLVNAQLQSSKTVTSSTKATPVGKAMQGGALAMLLKSLAKAGVQGKVPVKLGKDPVDKAVKALDDWNKAPGDSADVFASGAPIPSGASDPQMGANSIGLGFNEAPNLDFSPAASIGDQSIFNIFEQIAAPSFTETAPEAAPEVTPPPETTPVVTPPRTPDPYAPPSYAAPVYTPPAYVPEYSQAAVFKVFGSGATGQAAFKSMNAQSLALYNQQLSGYNSTYQNNLTSYNSTYQQTLNAYNTDYYLNNPELPNLGESPIGGTGVFGPAGGGGATTVTDFGNLNGGTYTPPDYSIPTYTEPVPTYTDPFTNDSSDFSDFP